MFGALTQLIFMEHHPKYFMGMNLLMLRTNSYALLLLLLPDVEGHTVDNK